MKNQKNTRTILGFILIAAITISAVIMLMNMADVMPWFYYFTEVDGGWKVCIDWTYGGILVGLLFFAVVIFGVRTCLYTTKSVSTPIKVMEGCIGLGLVLAIIAFFLPMNFVVSTATWQEAAEIIYTQPLMTAAFVMTWIALPLSLVSSIGVAFLNRRYHIA